MFKRLPATVIALGITSLFTDVASEMVIPLLPAFVAMLGASPTFLGLLEGLADAVAAILKYFSGRWTDRARTTGTRRRFVFAGYGLAAAVRPLLALATAPWHVLSVRVIDRIGKGIRSAPRDALIADSADAQNSGRAFGFHQAMDHAGAVVGPLLATAFIALGLQVRTIFALALVPGVLAVAAIAFAKEPVAQDSGPAAKDALILSPRLKQLMAILCFFAISNSSDVFLLLRLTELKAPASWLPLAWLTLNLSKMFWSARGGVLADRGVPRHWLLLAGWAVYAAAYVALSFLTVAWQAWVVMTLYGAFAGLAEPTEKVLVKELSTAAQRGRAFGLYHALVGAAAVPAGLLTGYLWQTFGAHVALLTGAVGAGLSAVVLLWWVRQGTQERPA